MNQNSDVKEKDIITVTGILSGEINGVPINGTVTGTANPKTGHVTNVFHNIDPAIGKELSSIGIAQTIVCAHMAIEVGSAKNLNSMAPMQWLQRVATFKLPSHKMECRQRVAWTSPNAAVVSMEYSGTLPSIKEATHSIPDTQCDFNRTSGHAIKQIGSTQALTSNNSQSLSLEIDYMISGSQPKWSAVKPQLLENANNTSSYNETTREITYNTDVRMLETL